MAAPTLRDRIIVLRIATGLDAKALSVLAGLGTSHVGMLERGDVKTISGGTADRLARVTGATRAWIAWGEGDAPAKETVAAVVKAVLAERGAA